MSGADISGIAVRIRENAVRRHLEENPQGETEGFKIEEEDVNSAINERNPELQMAAWA